MRGRMRGLIRWGWIALLPSLPVTAADLSDRPATRSVALWRLKPLGIEAATAERLELLLRAELSRQPGLGLQPRADTERRLAGKDELSACGGETACLCAIGRALGVELLVTGLLGELGDDYTFDLKLVAIGPCSEQGRINEALSGREDLLIPAIRQALVKLVAPDRHVGSLSVELPVEGAEIRVDGKLMGRSPLAQPIAGLRPGVHRLVIARQGYSDFQEDVPVRFEQVTRVKVDLGSSALTGLTYEREAPAEARAVVQAPPPPGRSRLWEAGWSLTGVGLALAAGSGLVTWRAAVCRSEVEAAARGEPPYLSADHQTTYALGQNLTLAARVGWGLAGASLLSGVILLVVDAAGGGQGSGPPVEVAPMGAGLVLTGRF
jgi:hypothetical protein